VAYARLAAEQPELVLLLAPRHPERLAAVQALAAEHGLPLVRFTALADGRALPDGAAVVLLDVVGPLAYCYALGDVAFVGGTLVPVGGHNLLEPARAGRPVVFGPHTANVAELAERLITVGGGVRVSSGAALADALAPLVTQPARAAEMGRRAQALVAGGQGALARHVKTIAARLSSADFARAAG
jgi:3-deoxy-D-manno-octulosonic-acid transferase